MRPHGYADCAKCRHDEVTVGRCHTIDPMVALLCVKEVSVIVGFLSFIFPRVKLGESGMNFPVVSFPFLPFASAEVMRRTSSSKVEMGG